MDELEKLREEKLKEEKLKTDIHSIKNNLTSFGLRLELLYTALVGNELTKDGGLVAGLNQMRDAQAKLVQRVDILEKKGNKTDVITSIIYAAIGFILAMILNFIIKK